MYTLYFVIKPYQKATALLLKTTEEIPILWQQSLNHNFRCSLFDPDKILMFVLRFGAFKRTMKSMIEINAVLNVTWVEFAIQIIKYTYMTLYILFKSMQLCAIDGQNSHRNVHHVTVITGASGATGKVERWAWMRWKMYFN